jgi:hypothetical protein
LRGAGTSGIAFIGPVELLLRPAIEFAIGNRARKCRIADHRSALGFHNEKLNE